MSGNTEQAKQRTEPYPSSLLCVSPTRSFFEVMVISISGPSFSMVPVPSNIGSFRLTVLAK